MSALIIIIGIAVLVYAVLPAVATIAIAPLLPFVTAYRLKEESPVKSILLIVISVFFLLAVLFLWLVQR